MLRRRSFSGGMLPALLPAVFSLMMCSDSQPASTEGQGDSNAQTQAAAKTSTSTATESATTDSAPNMEALAAQGVPNTRVEQAMNAQEVEVERIEPTKAIRVVMKKGDIRVRINQIDAKDFPSVRLHVSVTDAANTPLRVIDPSLFIVKENDQLIPPQDIRPVVLQQDREMTDREPLNIVLAIDKSGSMLTDAGRKLEAQEQPIAFARDAATSFLNELDPIFDNCEVMAFNHETQQLGMNAEARQGLAGLTAAGDTALYGALKYSVMRVSEKEGIRAVLLMSDGENDMSGREARTSRWAKTTLDEGLDLAERTSVPVFTIGFGSGAHLQVLQGIAEKTHASYFNTLRKEDLAGLYSQIRTIINNQYVITYYSQSAEAFNEASVTLSGFDEGRVYQLEEDQVRERQELIEEKANLNERETQLEADRKALDERSAGLDTKEADLLGRERNVQEREGVLAEEEARVEALRIELEKKEAELAQRDSELEALQARLNAIDSTLDQRENEIGQTESALRDRESALAQRTQRLTEQEGRLDRLQNELNTLQSSLNTRETELRQENQRLNTLAADLDRREAEVTRRATELDRRAETVNSTEQRLTVLERNLQTLQRELDQSRQNLTRAQARYEALRSQLVTLLGTVGETTNDALQQLNQPNE